MRKPISILLIVAVGSMLGGCGLFSGPDNYESYQKMYGDFASSKTARANAIVTMPCPEDPVAAAYCNSSKMMGQAFISLERFDISAPKTGYDVLYKATDSIVPVSGFYAMYKMFSIGITKAGNVVFGDGANVSGSFNPVNTYSTSVGSGYSIATGNGTTPPTVVEPKIVEPFVVTP